MQEYRKVRRLQRSEKVDASSCLIRHHLIDNYLCEWVFNVDQLKSGNVGIVVAIILQVDQSHVLHPQTTTASLKRSK